MIAIPNVEKPKACFSCSFNDGLFCSLIDDDSDALLSDNPVEEISTRRLDACPIIDIVRCGECKHWHEGEWYNTCDKHIGHGFMAEHFCSYGERKNKEGIK